MKVRIEGVNVKSQKIGAIKMVRSLTGWGLKESKDFVEAAPMDEQGTASLTLLVSVLNVNSVAELEVFIRKDTYCPPFSKIVDLEALPPPARPTIAYMRKELEENRKALDTTMKALAAARQEKQDAYNRLEEERKNHWRNEDALRNLRDENEELRNARREIVEECDQLRNELTKLREKTDNLHARIVMGGRVIDITPDGVTVSSYQ